MTVRPQIAERTWESRMNERSKRNTTIHFGARHFVMGVLIGTGVMLVVFSLV